MNAYTQVLEFFMENGIQLNSNQIEELKDICEATDDQKGYMKKMLKGKIAGDENGPGFVGAAKDSNHNIDRSKDIDSLSKAKSNLKDIEDKARKSGALYGSPSTRGQMVGKKYSDYGYNYSDMENKQNKIAGDAADKLFKEKEAWKDNKKYNEITNRR